MLMEPAISRFDLRWSMLGLNVRATPWFWLVGLFMGQNLDQAQILAWLGVWFVCILVHELGHALTAKTFGAPRGRIILYGFGGLAISPGGPGRGWRRALVIFMGPGAGFLLAAALWAGTGQGIDDWGEGLVGFAVHQAMWVCVGWGLINLLPVLPLDGGQLFYEGLLARWPRQAGRWARNVSLTTAFVAAAAFFVVDYTWAALLFAILGVQNLRGSAV